MVFVLLDVSREVQSNRLTSEGADGRWAAAAARLRPPQTLTAKLQGNGKEATDMTCTSKKATILLVQHDSTGRTSRDKWFCRPQEVHMPHCCSCPNVTQEDKGKPWKTLTGSNSICNTFIESLLVNTRGAVEGQAMLQTRSFTLNTQHTVFSVTYPKAAHAQLYLSCVLPALRAVKQCLKTEMKDLCKYMQQNLREFSQCFPDMSYGGNYFPCCFEQQRSLSRQALQWKALQTSQ